MLTYQRIDILRQTGVPCCVTRTLRRLGRWAKKNCLGSGLPQASSSGIPSETQDRPLDHPKPGPLRERPVFMEKHFTYIWVNYNDLTVLPHWNHG